jgi:hypothetical protein
MCIDEKEINIRLFLLNLVTILMCINEKRRIWG